MPPSDYSVEPIQDPITWLTELAEVEYINSSVDDRLTEQIEYCINAIFQQLTELAAQSIMAPKQQVDECSRRLQTLCLQLEFDALQGGLIMPMRTPEEPHQKTLFAKPILINCLIAELLLQADRYLYTGQLNRVAQQSIDYLVTQLENNSQRLITEEPVYALASLYNSFDQSTLHQELEQPELQLLTALICRESLARTNIVGNGVLISYKYQLADAANVINMPLKQAQIIEHSVRTKLNRLAESKVHHYVPIANWLTANCRLLQTISQALVLEDKQAWHEKVTQLNHQLMTCLKQTQLTAEQRIAIVSAGLFYLQVEFEWSCADELLSQLESIDFESFVPSMAAQASASANKSLQQLSLISEVVKQLNQTTLASIASHLEPALAQFNNGLWQVVLLKGDSVELDGQLVKLRSEFNPYRLIFCI